MDSLKKRSEQDRVNSVRWLCRTDVFFLLRYILGRKDLDHPWLFARCREVQAQPDNMLDLWAREHFKSTIVTFGLTIQDILASHGEAPLEKFGGEEVTVGLFSHTRPIAKGFLRQIMQEFERNQRLKDLFPDVLWANPKTDAPKWSEDDGIIVRRRSNPKEATIEAWGLVDGQPTSKHYRLRVYDDVVTKESVATPEMILKTTTAWEHSLNLAANDGPARYAGTIYNLFDTYSVMRSRGVRARVHPATKDGSDDCRPANCVLMSSGALAAKRRLMGPSTFSTQMLLNPKGGIIVGFKEEWLKYWPARHANRLAVALIVDPASKKKKTSDYTAIWVAGLGSDQNWYVLDHLRDRLNLKQRVTTVMALHRRWSPIFTGYEEYGVQADIEAIEWEQERENYRFDITPLGGVLAKEDRIKRLQPLFENHRIYLPEGGCVHTNWEGVAVDTIRAFIQEEYTAFPVLAHDDSLDCLARIEDEDVVNAIKPPSVAPPANPAWMSEFLAEHGGAPSSWMGR